MKINYFLSYIILINVIAYFIIYIDKQKAINKKWRISEKSIFILAILGGSVGAYISMFVFRHKIKKWYFALGIPCIIALQVYIFLILVKSI